MTGSDTAEGAIKIVVEKKVGLSEGGEVFRHFLQTGRRLTSQFGAFLPIWGGGRIRNLETSNKLEIKNQHYEDSNL